MQNYVVDVNRVRWLFIVVLSLLCVSGCVTTYEQDNEQLKTLKYNSHCKKRKKRLAWELMEYNDKFGDKNGDKALSLRNPINGSFSNSATSNSELYVMFIVNSSSEIDIMLVEYGKYFVKDSGDFDVDIKVAGVETELSGRNYSDRITLDKSSSKILYQYLRSDHSIKFFVSDEYFSSYRFELRSCHGFGYAYKKYRF
ncbi:MAG: hypothetical protein OXC44_08570 [Proteobacteria bacterium]|nr:hypothetical protein [Pseudomonadota bacterium]